MTETQSPEEDLAAEFQRLGKNLSSALHAAWESPERKKLTQEIEEGITQLGSALKQEFQAASSTSTGQRIKADVEDLTQRLRSGDVAEKVRQDILTALKSINAELQKSAEHWQPTPGSGTAEQQPGESTGEPGPSQPKSES